MREKRKKAGMGASTGLSLEAGGIAPLPDLFSAGGQQGGQTMTDLFTGSSSMTAAATPGSINAAPQDPSVAEMDATPEKMGVGKTSFETPNTAPPPATDSGGTPDAAKTPMANTAEKERTYSSSNCQVTGCEEDLSNQSRYNRRYRICDVHRKDLAIKMNSETMRFCQQCARLQSVVKFKGQKRSCQSSLDLHNKRQSEGASAAVAAGFITAPTCQVPGCEVDLLQHTVYNQRYKICPFHRIQESVDIEGQVVRFCQQCAKVHSVDDFEPGKRSCRAKLDRINNRREVLKKTLEERGADPQLSLSLRAFCQVPGCSPDPKDMKVYNLRNKVCNTHLAMLDVPMDGKQMRFCRQCARFEDTNVFDGPKRSCRTRLEKHNQRRRSAAQQAKAIQDGDETSTKTPKGSKAGAPRRSRRSSKTPAGVIPSCQVPGCGKELKEEKAYNLRYKVCVEHLAMPEVEMPEGKFRFCQQCARFQPIEDFDGLKRSCRQRLEKHNERGRAAYQKARAKGKTGEATAE